MVKFDQIEDLVADIAVVFNWPPAEIFMMTIGDVVD
ncbi:GpE family phage tail protein, partial [Salmonella enterica subsp. enterica serovar Braenderup]